MTDKLTKCASCSGRGYTRCECWPGDCICGFGDVTCEECGGEGIIDTSYEDDGWDGHDPETAPTPAPHLTGIILEAEARDVGVSIGIAMSVAFMLRDRDEQTMALEWWHASGITIEQCERIGVDEYDLAPIRAAITTTEGSDNGR